ncbi:MAG: sigma-54 dependent transcriptional regulator [Marinifilaceae bacterium]
MPNILVVDDERSIRNSLKDILEYEEHQVITAENGIEALSLIENQCFDLIFCDIKMPEMDGMEVLKKIKDTHFDVPVIMISGHGNIETAVEAIKEGAFDFIEKPLDLNRILITIKNATDKTVLVAKTQELQKRIENKYQMIGSSNALYKVKEIIDKVALTDARVLITGSNGTGKELVARQIHEKSKRASLPFIDVNCAAIPSELIESELFGHEKGAFTSANKQKKGKFEIANGGTLFLDEIGDMSLDAQAKLLRVLQEKNISRVGGDKNIKVDVRILAATNKNLDAEIQKGLFREDLYHRISVIIIKLPALNERKEDIKELSLHFLQQICSDMSITNKEISENALEALMQRKWKGNIRELRNVIERLIILGSEKITKEEVELYS